MLSKFMVNFNELKFLLNYYRIEFILNIRREWDLEDVSQKEVYVKLKLL